jgi:hypothetical protein
MKTIKANKKCGHIRTWLYKSINRRIGLDADWVQNHIGKCPRCHQRIASFGKVNLALSVLKSQPHKLDLLMRANTQAIGVLKHSLRRAPKACKLKAMLPEPSLLQRWGKYANPAVNAMACIVILLLMKIGVFSSMNQFQTKSQKVVRQYYTNHVGTEMTDEIFTA